MISKRTAMAFFVSGIVILSSIYLIDHYARNQSYMTAEEFYNIVFSNYTLSEGTIYDIRDTVTQVYTFNLPEIIDTHSTYGVNPYNVTTYTQVSFESSKAKFLIFSGDRTESFVIGKTVTFSSEAKRYEDSYFPDKGSIATVEQVYNFIKVYNILPAVIQEGNFSFVSFEKQYISNNSVKLKVENIFLPTSNSIKYSSLAIKVYNPYSAEDIPIKAKLFSVDGTAIGYLNEKRNESLPGAVRYGDYIVIDGLIRGILCLCFQEIFLFIQISFSQLC